MSNKDTTFPKNYSFTPLHWGIEFKESPIEGQGLFSTEVIPKDFVIGPSHFRVECTELVYDVPSAEFISHYHTNGLMRLGRLGDGINHSSNPNIDMVDRGCYFVFITNRRIEPGEELTVDYNLSPCLDEDKCGEDG